FASPSPTPLFDQIIPVPLSHCIMQPLAMPLPSPHLFLPQHTKSSQQRVLAWVVALIASPPNITAENNSASIKEVVFFILILHEVEVNRRLRLRIAPGTEIPRLLHPNLLHRTYEHHARSEYQTQSSSEHC